MAGEAANLIEYGCGCGQLKRHPTLLPSGWLLSPLQQQEIRPAVRTSHSISLSRDDVDSPNAMQLRVENR